MKQLLLSLIILTTGNVFGSELKLKGVLAKNLFNALPNELRESHPGSVQKSAREISCSAMAAGPGQTSYSCDVHDVRLVKIVLTRASSQKLFKALPHELETMHPGALTKKADGIVCGAMAAGPGKTSYACSINY